MPLYREFNSQEELDWEYCPEARLDDPKAFDKIIAQRQVLAEAARQDLTERQADIPYGPTLLERMDFYPASSGGPAMIFIHGGYWFDARLRKENYIWIAKGLNQAGVNVFIIDYQVCPLVTVDEITRQCRAAVAHVYRNAKRFDIDPDRLHVTGNSAGGHLTAMVAITDWVGDYGLPADIVKSGYPISGLYDLEPFRWTWLQPKIQLTGQQIRRNSPMFLVREDLPPLLISWGAEESDEFWRQSRDFGAAWAASGNDMQLSPQPGCNHSSAISGFADAGSELCRMILGHMENTWG
ncbi:alpha/beta hydrolase [Pseudodonghicola flavimaris]|uniref:Alpha/beta hydrolase n=1 Tax=Pseudodonghicola flavimaris TaxID=3050036 RepID=A0ABT7EWX4_9RHOB|nr:alpha/beta hydrolase [Pseudodonghicola flavimaris]MDK3016852.1 alpha/beta hydrolase [Pseudodonghicola flavimaris]